MTPPLLTPADVAAKLRISERGVRRLTRSGALAAVRVGGLVRYKPEDLARFLEAETSRAAASAPAPRPKRRARGGGPGVVVPLFSELDGAA